MFRRWSRKDAENLSDCAYRASNAVKWSHGYVCCPEGANALPHRADSFLMSSISCRIFLTQPFEIPTALAISRAFNRRSANTRSWTLITLNVILRDSLLRRTWAWLIKKRRAIKLQLVKPIFYGRHRSRRVTKRSLILLRDFSSKKQ